MKKSLKIISVILSIITILGICSPIASAYQADDPAYDFIYAEGDDGLYIDGIYEDVSGEVTIPESIFGKPVVGIMSILQKDENGDFVTGNYKITKINVPKSVKCIDYTDGFNHYLYECNNNYFEENGINITAHPYFEVSSENEGLCSENGVLYNKGKTTLYSYPESGAKNFTTPDTVEEIEGYAFYENNNIENVTLTEGVKIAGYRAFDKCHNLNLYVPSTVENISYQSCCNISSLSISESNPYYSMNGDILLNKEQTIVYNYVKYCDESSGDLNIVLPNTVKEIKSRAFQNTGITSIYISDSVEDISDEAFPESYRLEAINVSENNKYYSSEDGVLYSKNKAVILTYPSGKKDSTFRIPGTVEGIGDLAFLDAINIENLYIPKSVTHTSDGPFYMTKLKEVKLKNIYYEGTTDDWMKIQAFDGTCNPLILGADLYCEGKLVKNLYIDTEEIPYDAFAGCTSIESVTLSDNVNTIDTCAFWNCINLKTVKTGSGLRNIGAWAFRKCTSLREFYVESDLDNVGYGAFSYCDSLSSTNIMQKTSDADDYIFYESNNIDLTTKILVFINRIRNFINGLKKEENINEIYSYITTYSLGYENGKPVYDEEEMNGYPQGGGGGAAALARLVNAVVKIIRKKK